MCEMAFCCTSFCFWILSTALVYISMVMLFYMLFFLAFVTCAKSLRNKVTKWLKSMLEASIVKIHAQSCCWKPV